MTISNDFSDQKESIIKDLHKYSSDGFNIAEVVLRTYNVNCAQLELISKLWKKYHKTYDDKVIKEVEYLVNSLTRYIKDLNLNEEAALLEVNSMITTMQDVNKIPNKSKDLISTVKKIFTQRILSLSENESIQKNEEIKNQLNQLTYQINRLR